MIAGPNSGLSDVAGSVSGAGPAGLLRRSKAISYHPNSAVLDY
jgi:hypothetical protein